MYNIINERKINIYYNRKLYLSIAWEVAELEVGEIIAENLRRLRMERNLSLGQLAEQCGVSKVMLSQIEKGDTNPTINTLWKIAHGLKVPYTALLEQQEHVAEVLHKGDIPAQQGEDAHYRLYCYYENGPQRNFELFQIELDAGHSATSVGHTEKSQEYVLVTAGELTLQVGDATYTLGRDDSICFAAAVEHTYRSTGVEMLTAAIINFYPI